MRPADRDSLILQRALARALRRAAIRQRARLATVKAATSATWQRARGS